MRNDIMTLLKIHIENGNLSGFGVSCLYKDGLDLLIKNFGEKPLFNQIEIGPSCSQVEFVNYMIDNDIIPIAHSPLTICDMNFRRLIPQSYLSLVNQTNLDNPNRNVSVHMLIICWLTNRGIIPIPCSGNVQHVAENILISKQLMTNNTLDNLNNSYTIYQNITYKNIFLKNISNISFNKRYVKDFLVCEIAKNKINISNNNGENPNNNKTYIFNSNSEKTTEKTLKKTPERFFRKINNKTYII